MKFYASARLDIRRIGAIKKGDTVIGNRTRVKVVKNKMAPPFRNCEFDIIFNEGISRSGDLVDLAVEASIIDKAGSWYSLDDERIGQGRDNARDFLVEHPELYAKVEQKVREHHGIIKPQAEADAPNTNIAESKKSDDQKAKAGGNGKDPKTPVRADVSSRKKSTVRA